MSRVGKQPIVVPSGVECKLDGVALKVKGPKGQLNRDLHPNMKVTIEKDVITVTRPTDGRIDRSLHGLTRTHTNNIEGFGKSLSHPNHHIIDEGTR
jgi:large subunit ribosomal protein L6